MSVRYESGSPFNTGAGGGTADYIFAMLFAAVLMLLTYPLVVMTFPMPPMFCKNLVFFVMYIWSKRNPTAQANIWGVPVQANYLPFAYLGLTVFMGKPYFDLLHGLLIGHLYYFLADVYPQVAGTNVLVTPAFLVDKFGIGTYRPAPDAVNPADAPPGEGGNRGGIGDDNNNNARAAGHTWGTGGQALGR